MSNISLSGGTGANAPVTYRLARGQELAFALAIVLGSSGKGTSTLQMAEFYHLTTQGRINPAETWVAAAGDQLLWAALPVVSPGRTMLFFAGPLPPEGDEIAWRLISEICREYARRGVHLAQALVDTTHLEAREFFIKCDFAEVAELIYLTGPIPRATPAPPLPFGYRWLSYSPMTHGDFAAAIPLTYEQSLDCPALNGVRDMEDVIAGHKATGEFDPNLWSLLVCNDQPAGVILLSRVPNSDIMELVYLGLRPEFRGKGIGEILMNHGMNLAAADHRKRLTLAVDSRNTPAMKLYFRHGLQRIAAKVAMIKDIREMLNGE